MPSLRSGIVVALSVLVLSACRSAQPSYRVVDGRIDTPIRLKVKCTGDELSVKVKPFTVRAYVGETVTWQGANSNDIDVQLTIEPKAGSPWPFPDQRYIVPANGRVTSGPIQQVDSAQYDIKFVCPTLSQNTIVVDPDIIITGGSRAMDDPQ